jgi:signal transduction histidine kinase
MSQMDEISNLLRGMKVSPYQRQKIERAVTKIVKNYEDELYGVATLMSDVLHEATLASEMKSQFLASMSHELRTPLNSIIGFLELVIYGLGFKHDPINDPSARQYLEYAHKSAGGLLALINDLLDLSKIEAGRMELVIVDVNVRGLAESVYREYEVLAGQKGIELRYCVDDAMPETVKSDKQKLRSILVNLLGNAIKFTQAGYVEMAFSRQGDGWKIRVGDTGIGFDMKRERELWEPFIQMEGGSARQYGGTGLGMVIVQRMTELLGGQVTADSRVGEGSVFTVTLPQS